MTASQKSSKIAVCGLKVGNVKRVRQRGFGESQISLQFVIDWLDIQRKWSCKRLTFTFSMNMV